jgi:parallel beta-helix repeat protein
LFGSSNITISNCILGPSSDVGIYLYNCTNVTIINCSFMSNYGGVYAVSSTGIKVDNNQFTNVVGGWPRGQFVQFNNVTGTGNEIRDNVGENVLKPGSRDPVDLINLYSSSGTAASPIVVSGNRFRGGGPDTTGGGILLGDGGGSYETAQSNIMVDAGQYGIAIAGGSNNSLLNNQIYARQQSWTNVGIYVSRTDASSCSNNTVEGNAVNFTHKDGTPAPDWLDATTCSATSDINNNWSATFGPEILPDRLLCPLLMAYYKFNANWNDASGSDLDAVSNNGAFGGQGEDLMCANFDGTARVLTLPISPWLQAQSERFTVSCWIRPRSVTGVQGIAMAQNSNGYDNGWRMTLEDNTFNGHLVTDAGTADIYCPGIPQGIWTQLVLVYDGKNLKGYVNGMLQDSRPISGNVTYPVPNSPAEIGYSSGTNYLNAFMDEFKFYDGSLNDDEILSDYNSNYQAVNAPQPETRAYYSFNNNWLDNSGNGLTATSNGVGFVCNGANSISANFNGSSYLTLPSSPLLNPFSSTLTVSCWIKPATVSGIKGIAQAQNSDGYNYGWRMLLLDGTLNARVVTNQGGVDVYAGGIQADVWNHVVMTYDGLSLKAYVNGVLQGNSPWGGYIIYYPTTSTAMQIGLCNGNNYYFNGYMDEFKFIDGPLSATQIQQDYNTTYPVINATPDCSLLQKESPAVDSASVNTLEQIGEERGYHVWPNPATTNITISLTGAAGGGIMQADLYNSLGQSVRSISGPVEGMVLPVGDLSTGVYYLRIRHQGNVIIRKIVVRR